MENLIQYEQNQEGYGVITLHRPQKRNAINLQMAEDLLSTIKQAGEDHNKFLVITSSNDETFCSGGDLQDYHPDLDSEVAFSRLYAMKEVLHELVSFPVPTIGLLNGDAYGGGCELATACDIRIAKESAFFGFVQTNLGITPGWGGGSLLYEKVPTSFAFHWIVEAGVYNAISLYEQGWIQRVIPTDKWDENQILTPYMKKSIHQMEILKKQYKDQLTALSLSAKMNEEVRLSAQLWSSEEHKQAVNSFLNK